MPCSWQALLDWWLELCPWLLVGEQGMTEIVGACSVWLARQLAAIANLTTVALASASEGFPGIHHMPTWHPSLNDGLVSTASLMLGVGAGADSLHAMQLAGIAGLVAGALSMAAGGWPRNAHHNNQSL
jgi:hypothetical protein